MPGSSSAHPGFRDMGSAWLVPLADLSMILYIITAAALSAQNHSPPQENMREGGFAQGAAMAVFVDAPGGPSLADWLATRRPGPGELLTVEARYAPGDRNRTAQRADELAAAALAAGVEPRVIMQAAPAGATRSTLQAVIAHDADPPLPTPTATPTPAR
ncbi:hypothetical protein [Altererythrobacter lauratis]|uniref:Biopolymer transporter ExbD n=1 Tax=Alteraurantiacibacter lauratis TaxID=2054627 RepID=A0ABV7ED44_9SPHN